MGTGPEPVRGTVPSHGRRRLDVRVVPHRRRSVFRVQDWRVRTKLATVLVIPAVAFLVLAGVQTAGLIGRAGMLSQFAEQVAIGHEITVAVHHLQQERDRSAGELAGLRVPGVRLDPAEWTAAVKPLQANSDEAMRRLRVAAEPLASGDVAWRLRYTEVLEAYDQVATVRTAAAPGVLSSDTILGTYHRLIDELLHLLAEPSPGSNARELSDAVLRYVRLARVKEFSSRIRAQLYVTARAGRYEVEDQVLLTDLRAQQLTELGAFRVAATADQIRRYDRMSLDPAFVEATNLEEQSLPVGGTDPRVLPAKQWWAVSEQRHELLRQVEAGVLDDAVSLAGEARNAQVRRTLLVVGGILTVLLLALLISALIGRSLARSMRLLRGQALRIAQMELPDTLDRLRTVTGGVPDIEVAPAVVRSLDEIGELAEAFVAVHRSAVSVAVEQAIMRRNVNAMFVNLARRSQVLVERQLELLDELERDESDPDQLENLFKLDHLAARMRRNDESLLVLSGSESTRRWNRPVGLAAVLLAASAEIEQYQRIRHGAVAELHIVGHAVGELVHLLAELLENATAFSRPDTVVRITARADSGGAVVEIADEGLGMSSSALADANRILATPPTADVAASERMGLFVVSHLAARHQIEVRLCAAGEGLVARVTLPGSLLAPAPDQEWPLSPRVSAVGAARPAAAPGRGAASAARVGATYGSGAGRLSGAQVPALRSPARPVPMRAEDVLAPPGGKGSADGSAWWSRQGPQPKPAEGRSASGPRAPVIGGVTDRGLPVRVPMAQLAAVDPATRPSAPPSRHDPDPDAVGGMLSRLYQGVRRAESEDDTREIVMPPDGVCSGGEQQ